MLAALIFDLDGTLVDTDPLHFRIWQQMLAPFGLTIDRNFYRARISGRLNPDILRELLPQLSAEDAARFAAAKEARFRELAADLKPLVGFEALYAWASEHHLPTALVTNAPRANAEFMLTTLGLEQAFEPVILAEELPVGKPDPLPYQVALDALGVAASQAIAFEDSPSGLRSAVAAAIPTVGIATTHPAEVLTALGAALVVEDFRDARLRKLLAERTEVAGPAG